MNILHIANIGDCANGIGSVLVCLEKEQRLLGHNVKVVSLRENKIYKDTKIIYVEDVNRFQKVDKIYSCYKIERWFFSAQNKTISCFRQGFYTPCFFSRYSI